MRTFFYAECYFFFLLLSCLTLLVEGDAAGEFLLLCLQGCACLQGGGEVGHLGEGLGIGLGEGYLCLAVIA